MSSNDAVLPSLLSGSGDTPITALVQVIITTMVLFVGITAAGLGLLGIEFSFQATTILTSFLIGTIEVPRLRTEQIRHEGVRVLMYVMFVVLSILFVWWTTSDLMSIAGVIAFLLLLGSSIVIQVLVERSKGDTVDPSTADG